MRTIDGDRDLTVSNHVTVESSGGEREPTMSISVNVGTSDGDRDLTVSNPVTVENSDGECAPVVPTSIITPAVPLIRPERVRIRP